MLPVTLGSWTGHPQTHRCGGTVECRWPVTQVACGVSPSTSLLTDRFLSFTVYILLLSPRCNTCYTLHLSLTPSPFQHSWIFKLMQVQSLEWRSTVSSPTNTMIWLGFKVKLKFSFASPALYVCLPITDCANHSPQYQQKLAKV